ncbi:MAG TPA: hypothetical protein VK691_05245 [Solirubrobacteraceae bacterium]|jgi:hypothetical protein|nr:hypothetical protein [Solirubrobacteraceae bacterium]
MAYLVICFFFGLAGGIVGRIKGSSFVLWFLISAVVPIFGLMAAVAYRSDRDELRRQCPKCGRVTKLHDALCTRCGEELEYPEQVLAPESFQRSAAPHSG